MISKLVCQYSWLLTVFVFLLGVPKSSWAGVEKQVQKRRSTPDTIVTSLAGDDLEERITSEQKLKSDRDRRIKSLLAILKTAEENSKNADPLLGEAASVRYYSDKQAFAIRALGLMRATEAVEPLLDRIDMKFLQGRSSLNSPDLEPFLCVDALTMIGKPASKAALNRLKSEGDTTKRELMVRVVRGVEGDSVGKFMISQAIKNAEGKQKANLQAALRLFNKSKLKAEEKSDEWRFQNGEE